jgi:hypothetical protein
MIVALGADVEVALDFLGIDDLVAVLALGPDPFGHLYLLGFNRRDRCF